MYYFNYFKSLSHITATLGLLSLSLVLGTNSANAASLNFDSNFDSDLSGWNITGDVSTQPTLTGTYGIDSKSYRAGTGTSNQLVITNSCSTTAYTPTTTEYDDTECFQIGDETEPRNDDLNANVGVFNYSGNDQADANSENSGSTVPGATEITNIQEFLGLDANALDIDDDSIAKEGSATLLGETLVASNPFTVSFDWNYLTNDGQDPFGNTDYGFVIIYEVDSDSSTRIPIVLAQSDSSTVPTMSSGDDAYALSTVDSYASEILPAGTYQVGFGVVDVNGTSASSALLVDNFSAREVPFEFSPGLGLIFMASIFSSMRLQRQLKKR